MGKIVAIGNEKGGVGKTTTVVNLAYYFSHVRSKKVLVVDMDPQCNLTDKYFDQNDESKAKPTRRLFCDQFCMQNLVFPY